MTHPADALSGEPSEEEVNFRTIAKQVEGIRARALRADQFEDVITLLEYMQEQVVAAHKANQKLAKELEARTKALVKREREAELKFRAAKVACGDRTSTIRQIAGYLRG